MGRRLRTHLDLLHPDISQKISIKQDKQKQKSSSTVSRKFLVNDRLYAKDFHNKNKWIPVTVTKVIGPLSYVVITNDGISLRRHVDHLRFRYTPDAPPQPSGDIDDFDDWPLSDGLTGHAPVEPTPVTVNVPSTPSTSRRPKPTRPRQIASKIPVRRSTRERPPVDRYSPVP